MKKIGKINIVRISAAALILAVAIVLNVLCLAVYDQPLRTFLGVFGTKSTEYVYNETEYNASTLRNAKSELSREIAAEGIVMLEKGDALPYAEGTEFSLFGYASVDWSGNATGLKSAFESAGVSVNETLWDWYIDNCGAGKKYSRGSGSLDFGDAMDYSLAEPSLSELRSVNGLLESAEGTIPVFVMTRICGEGVDPARGMYGENEKAAEADKTRSYLEPTSIELEIISYLNENFDDVIVFLNSPNPIEAGFVREYENVDTVFYVPPTGAVGAESLPRMLTGEINPSGRLADTYAYDVLGSPAAMNVGDFAYYNGGEATGYNYITYAEGIYVGYRYYETRYEDAVLEQGHAGDYDYAAQVQYPFGYGASMSEFAWSDYECDYDETDHTFTVSVNVTNTSDVPGKEVVQVYARSPYTDYDKQNGVEKSAVQLVAFAKTDELVEGASEKVELTFSRDVLRSYDVNGHGTYIFEDGDYYITAAPDAHTAVNNILLCMEPSSTASLIPTYGRDEAGNADMASSHRFVDADLEFDEEGVDAEVYSIDLTSETEITNRLGLGTRSDITYLTRNDWTGTFPQPDGSTDRKVASEWGNRVEEGNSVGYLYITDISDEDLAAIDAKGKEASGNPDLDPSGYEKVTFGADSGLELIDLRGKDYDDPEWGDLLDQLSANDMTLLITRSGYGSPLVSSVNKPASVDSDSSTGLVSSSAAIQMPAVIMLAQTYDRDLFYEYGVLVGNDGLLGNRTGSAIVGWYSPAMNIHRTPFTARAHEYPGEDPFLSGVCSSEQVKGAASMGMYTFIKHFAINDQDLHRGDRGQGGLVTWCNEQAAREIYLKPFEMCIKCGTVEQKKFVTEDDGSLSEETFEVPACNALMTSFNRIGYTWAGGCYDLITGILREEWDFNGFIVTDFDNGGFMDTEQMIYAGASAKLRADANTSGWVLSANDNMSSYYAREAVHQILYTITNSAAMNGLYHGIEAKAGFPVYGLILIGVNVLAAAGIAVLAVFTVRNILKLRKEDA